MRKNRRAAVYQGRKRKEVDAELLAGTIAAFQKDEMTLQEALAVTGLSKSTFYRRMREM